MAEHAVIAVVFDFDDTLAPDSTTRLLRQHGIDPEAFWRQDVAARVQAGWDPVLAWLDLVLGQVGPGRAFGALTNADLGRMGRDLDDKFYDGIPQIFDDLRGLVRTYPDTSVEFFALRLPRGRGRGPERTPALCRAARSVLAVFRAR